MILHFKAGEHAGVSDLGPYRIETLIPESSELAMTAYRVSIAPGKLTATSYHKLSEELYFVLEGTGVAILDGVEHRLAPGDFLRLPPGTRHAFRADAAPLRLLDIHSPGSRPNRDVFFEGPTPPGFAPAANGEAGKPPLQKESFNPADA